MRTRRVYIVLFTLAVCGIAYLSIPTEDTLVEMSRDDNNAGRTLSLLRQRYDREPENVETALELAELYAGMNDAGAAREILRATRLRRPDDARIQKRVALLLLADNQPEAALAVLPPGRRDRDFYTAQVACYQKTGDLLGAEKALQNAEGENSSNPEVWKTLAGWRMGRYDLNGAAWALRRALELDPGDAAAWETYFENCCWRLDVDEAVLAAEKLETLQPLAPSRLETVLALQLTRRDTSGAILASERLSRLPGAFAGAAIDRAILMYRRGETEEADRVLLEAATDPSSPRHLVGDAIGSLQDSAQRAGNLELALRLAAIPSGPENQRKSRALAVDIAREAGRLDEVDALLRPMLADPDADAETLTLGLSLAYHAGDYRVMPELFARLERAGGSIDDLLYSLLSGDDGVEAWRRNAGKRPGSPAAWAGLVRAASLAGDVPETRRALDAGLAVLDHRDAVDAFAFFEAILYLAGIEPEGSPERRIRLEQALAFSESAARGPLAGSRWFMLISANLNNRMGRPAEAERLWNAAAASHSGDVWSWPGIVRMAAARGDGETVEAVLRQFQTKSGVRTPEEIRGLAYACLALCDYYREGDPARAAAWLARAGELAGGDPETLSPEAMDDLLLAADIAEREGAWPRAMRFWRRAADREPVNLAAWLGVARAAIAQGDADAAWEALDRANALPAGDPRQRLQLAWQFLAAADATPAESPRRRERLAWAEHFAGERLGGQGDAELAAGLIWRAIAREDVAQARAILGRMEQTPPELHAALAESLLDLGLKDEARIEAESASRSEDGGVLVRVARVFSQLGEKERTRAILDRASGIPGDITAGHLLEMADAYGGIGDYPRQFAYIERRARMGGEKEWLDAVDRRAWAGDFPGSKALLDEANRLYPGSPALLDRRLTLLADNNRPGEVVSAFEAGRQLASDVETKLSADALAALGVSYDDLRSAPKARRYFRLSLEKEPANKRGSVGLARLLRRDGNPGGAIRQLRLYVAAHADDPWGWLELANTRSDVQQSGRREYLRVIELTRPDARGDIPADVRAARAVALRQLGREKEAIALFKATMGPGITDPDISCDYAQIMMEIGKYDEAERILRDTVKVFPYHVWAYRLEATILVRRRKYDMAVERLQEALRWSPRDGEVQRDLAFAAQLWERPWKAQNNWLAAGE